MLLINDTVQPASNTSASRSLVKLPWMIDGATCLATEEEGSTVTHRGSIVSGKHNSKGLMYSSITSSQFLLKLKYFHLPLIIY